MQIFTYDAWAMCMLLIILSSAAFLILENVGRAKFHGTNDSEEFTMSNSLALSLGMLIQNNYAVEMSKMSSRMLYLAISASTLVLFAYYTCDMTSRLTGPSVIPIKSLDDVKKYGYKIIIASASAASHLRIVAPHIYEDAKKVSYPESPEDQVKFLLEHPNHFLYHEDTEAVTSNDLVSLSIDETSLVNLAFAFQLNSEFTNLFNYHLNKMGESGVMKRFRDSI